jgi:hypothetical protein
VGISGRRAIRRASALIDLRSASLASLRGFRGEPAFLTIGCSEVRMVAPFCATLATGSVPMWIPDSIAAVRLAAGASSATRPVFAFDLPIVRRIRPHVGHSSGEPLFSSGETDGERF